MKAQLVEQGVSLAGACGAFEITTRVAWRLREEGAGLRGGKSGGQNRCGEYAVDIVMYPDGRSFDILVDSGATNQPAWGGPNDGDLRLWRVAIDPGGTVGPSTAPAPTLTAALVPVPAPTLDLSQVKAWMEALAAQERAHAADARDRDERIDADQKAIAASHYEQLATQLAAMSRKREAHAKDGHPLGFLNNRTFLEVVAGITGVAIARK